MTRYFTIAEANRTLPLVRRIVRDIVTDYRYWKDRLYRYELAAAGDRADDGESPEAARLRDELDRLAHSINAWVEELAPIGCALKGFEDGLVDFPSRLEDRDILLCWKLDEPEIMHWHELDTGFAGRQLLRPDLIREIGP